MFITKFASVPASPLACRCWSTKTENPWLKRTGSPGHGKLVILEDWERYHCQIAKIVKIGKISLCKLGGHCFYYRKIGYVLIPAKSLNKMVVIQPLC